MFDNSSADAPLRVVAEFRGGRLVHEKRGHPGHGPLSRNWPPPGPAALVPASKRGQAGTSVCCPVSAPAGISPASEVGGAAPATGRTTPALATTVAPPTAAK